MSSFFPNVSIIEAYNALIYFDIPPDYASHLVNLVTGKILPSKTLPNKESFYENMFNKKYAKSNRNLPMGNPLCPLISSLVLYKHFAELDLILNKDVFVTGYADDNSLFFNNKGYNLLSINLVYQNWTIK